jgi:enterochelin esterase family protein
VWTLTVGPVAPNRYIYKIRIDGALGPDPNNTLTWAAAQPGYSTVVVPGDGPRYYDAKNVPHGTVTRHVYHSDVTDGEREMFVYTPPGYDPADEYSVLYLLGGSGEIAGGWDYDGRASFIADNLLADGLMEPTIIAMPNNQMLHRRHPEHTARTFDLFERELMEEIVPLVESAYSVRADRRGRALAGLSMGGRHAQRVGFRQLDAFASFGILSAGLVPEQGESPQWVSDPDGFNDRVDYLFVGLGTYENQPTNRSVVFHEALEQHGIDHDYYIGGDGGHDWGTWRDHLHYMLPKLWRAE